MGFLRFVDQGIQLPAFFNALAEVLFRSGVAGLDDAGVDAHAFHIPGLEPLSGEVPDKFLGPVVGEQTFDLRGQVLPQLAFGSQIHQFSIRHGGPQKI